MKYYTSLNNENILKKRDVNYNNKDEEYCYDIQNKKYCFSIGTPQLSHGKYQWCALYNPKNSSSNLLLDEICIVNFCTKPIIESVFFNPHINFNGFKYMYGISNRLDYEQNSNGVVIIYEGNDDILNDYESNNLKVLQPFYTNHEKKYKKICITPGNSILIMTNTLDYKSLSSAISFTWWENIFL